MKKEGQESLNVVPVTFRQACEFVTRLHRHNKPPMGMKFAIGVTDSSGILRGVAIAGRPISRFLDDGLTLEVNRTCTDGFSNANSFLYGAVWRTAKAMGYKKCVTYTQFDESGSSLRAAGFIKTLELSARKSWFESSGETNRGNRDIQGTGNVARIRWEIKCQ